MNTTIHNSKLTPLPLMGRIAAGQPIEAIAGQERLDLSDLLGSNRYALQVQGNSMIGAGILDGDLVIIEPCDTADDGAIVVALIDDEEATLKRLKRLKSGRIKLIAENPDIPPFHLCGEAGTDSGRTGVPVAALLRNNFEL